jgi:ATP-binding cassette subfamily B protein
VSRPHRVSAVSSANSLLGRWGQIGAGGRSFGRALGFALRLLVEAGPRLAVALGILTLLQAALPPLNVRLTQLIVNHLTGDPAGASLSALLALYLALHLATAVLAPKLNAVQAVVNERLTGGMNLRLLARVNAFSDLAPFEDPALHNELQALEEQAPYMSRDLIRAVAEVCEGVLTALGLCLLLASIHPLVPVLLLGAMLPDLLAQRENQALRWDLQVETAELQRRLDAWLDLGTSARDAREVQLLGVVGWIRDQYAASLRELERRRGRVRRRLLGRSLAGTAVRFAGTAGVFAYLISRGIAGEVRPGDFVLTIGSLFLLDDTLRFLPLHVGWVIEGGALAERFQAFLAEEEDEGPGATRLPLPPGALRRGIAVERLSFRYPGREEPVLRDVSFAIRPGETVALVGKNGAGKTTLVKLLTGLYRPDGGRIRIDGRDLAAYDQSSLRSGIAVVFQDYSRYFLTVGENIGLGRVEAMADRARIARAAREGGSAPLIERLEQTYETRLGKEFGGIDLSGGEWQKLALSRAFMRDADLLILDEPTAALDVRAEAEIYERFRSLLGGRAGLLISHRFSTVRMADRILVLEGGRIVEEGTHASLRERDGLYASMFRLQAAPFQAEVENDDA